MTERLLAAEIRRLGSAAIRAIAEVELDFVVVAELEPRGKRPSGLAAKTLERTDRAVGEQRFGLGNLELTAGDDLPHPEVAGLALELLVLLVHFAAAFRAARGERREIAGNRIALVVFGLRDDVLGHTDDLAHELLALKLAMLHLRQPEFPVGGELGREKLRNAQPVQERH